MVILSMGNDRVDTSTATGKLILNMMVSVARFEREMMKRASGGVPKAMRQADKVKALVAVGVDRVKIQ